MARRSISRKDVLRLVRNADEPLSVADLAKQFGVSGQSMKRTVARLVKEDKVTFTGATRRQSPLVRVKQKAASNGHGQVESPEDLFSRITSDCDHRLSELDMELEQIEVKRDAVTQERGRVAAVKEAAAVGA